MGSPDIPVFACQLHTVSGHSPKPFEGHLENLISSSHKKYPPNNQEIPYWAQSKEREGGGAGRLQWEIWTEWCLQPQTFMCREDKLAMEIRKETRLLFLSLKIPTKEVWEEGGSLWLSSNWPEALRVFLLVYFNSLKTFLKNVFAL